MTDKALHDEKQKETDRKAVKEQLEYRKTIQQLYQKLKDQKEN